MKKRIVAIVLALLVTSCCLFVPANAAEDTQVNIPEGMTLADFCELSYDEQIALIDGCYDWSTNVNARYKSGEDDPTHSDISAAGISAFIADKGFWATGTDGLGLALTIAIYSLAPDKVSDESYTASNADHFYLVSKGTGLYGGTSASERFEEYFNAAVKAQKAGNEEKAAEHLGRALHYIQDVSVPHHTKFALTVAHSKYEAFCDENIETYLGDYESTIESYYIIWKDLAIEDFVPTVAGVSTKYYDDVKNSAKQEKWDSTAKTLTRYSASVTSAVLYRFAIECDLTLTTEVQI